jgi:RNA polymerase sigma-70 factor, ECF subfamily
MVSVEGDSCHNPACSAVYDRMSDPFQTFESHRQRLFGVAYRMLGSRADTEDILQEAYLRWHSATAHDIRSPESWLVTTVTRLCIDQLRLARTSRETYVGPWLPEPLVGDASPPADSQAELASSLSVAFLVLLERLAPEERAAFLLHEVFESNYTEIAQILGKSEVACRAIVSRARRRVREQRPRVEVTEVARKALLERLVQAVTTQDKSALLSLLADEASWMSDGGGKAKAARRIIRGRERVARFVLAVLGRHAHEFVFTPIRINNEPGLAIESGGRVFSVISIRTDGHQILDVFTVLNPDKLPHALMNERKGSTPEHKEIE